MKILQYNAVTKNIKHSRKGSLFIIVIHHLVLEVCTCSRKNIAFHSLRNLWSFLYLNVFFALNARTLNTETQSVIPLQQNQTTWTWYSHPKKVNLFKCNKIQNQFHLSIADIINTSLCYAEFHWVKKLMWKGILSGN